MNATANRWFALAWPPALFGVAFVALWEVVVRGFNLKPYFLPAPSAIAAAVGSNFDRIVAASMASGANALIGLLTGTILGVLASFVLMRFNVVNELVSPLAIALNAIPIVVLVAVFQNMYSTTSEVPRRLMVCLIVFFIILVNVAKGLRQVDPIHLELMKSYAASPADVLTKIRIPNALPYLFTALKVAAPTAVITAFVSEYFGGRQNGLGYFIPSNFATSKTAVAWSYVVGACVLGLLFYVASVVIEAVTARRRGAGPA